MVFHDKFALRLKHIYLEMEDQRNVFPMLYLLLTKIMCFFSGIIDVERQNGIKKWIYNAKRDRLLTSISPNQEEVDALRVWFVEVAKIYWKNADRVIDCKELDLLCAENEKRI